MKKYVLVGYMAAVAATVAALAVVIFVGPTPKQPESAGRVARREAVLPAASSRSGSCVPVFGNELSVGGLGGADVPLLPGAQRLAYVEDGQSQYTARADERSVFNYYLDKMSSRCWELSALTPHGAVWKQDGKVVSLAVVERGLGTKTVLSYEDESDGAVLGLKLAQGSCSSSQYWCNGACVPIGTACSDSSGNTIYSACPSDQFSCNGTCVPMGTNCPVPSTGCGSGYYMCNGTCIPSSSTCGGSGSGTQTQCTTGYSLNGTYSCDYSKCPNGCSYGSNGCPSGCYVPTSCSGEYQQTGSTFPSCNYTKCPSGCTWGSNGCPSGCNTTSNNYSNSCPTGQYWCNNVCVPNSTTCPGSGSGSYTSCPSDQYSCNGACVPMGTACSGSGTYNNTTCPSGQYNCNGACIPSGSTCSGYNSGSSCPSGQYWCNGACVPSGTSCSGSGTYNYTTCPSGQYNCNGACVPSGTTCSGSGTQNGSCGSGMYSCNGSCLPIASACYSQGSTSCAPGYSFCSSANTCITSGSTCAGTTNQQQTFCSGDYAQNGTYACNTSKCPNGCTFGANGCPTACYSYAESSCRSEYAMNGSFTCNYSKCPQGCKYGTDNCPSACIGSEVKTTPPPTPICPSGQYTCNNVCVPTGTSCNGYNYYEPGQTQCANGQYYCASSKSCVSSGSPCADSRPVKDQPEQPYPNQNNDQNVRREGDMDRNGYNQGPSEQDQKRMDEERFRMMKRGLSDFERGYKQIERMVKRATPRLKKAGVGIPPELTAALAQAPVVIKKIKDAKTADELETLMDDIQDISEAMRDWGPRFGDLERLAEMLKRADKDVLGMKRKVDQLAKGVKKMPATEGMVDELRALLDSATTAVKEAKALASTDPDGALSSIESGLYDGMEEFWNAVAEVDMVQNLARGLSQGRQELARAEGRVRSLERSKKISQEEADNLRGMLAGIKEVLTEVQVLAKQKNVDVDTLRNAAENLWGSIQEFEERMDELGQSLYQPQIKSGQNYDFEVPEGFDFRGSGGGGGNSGPGLLGPPVEAPGDIGPPSLAPGTR